jgi:N-acetyl-gamma-glutamyl-phosphate reductase
MTEKLNIAVLGASGYTGAELLRLLAYHPYANVTALSGESQAGKSIAEVYAHLSHLSHKLVKLEDIDYDAVDVVFCCLPHGTTQPVLAALPENVRIVDLSADFRLHSAEAYAHWYGHPHQALALQSEAVYGLTEHYRDQVRKARLVANPGCYPTCSLLALLPLLKAGAIKNEDIIIDAMSGVTGAGRAAKQPMLFSEVNDGAKAYGVGGHRHAAEIEQEVSLASGNDLQVCFTAHLVPMSRGMSATIHVKLADGMSADDLRDVLRETYAGEPFVQICEKGIIPSTHEVRGTNQCRIAVAHDRVAGKAILVSVIDNLVKGASGQALQNMNHMFGYEETVGLLHGAVFP